jgi:hypothetical protein
MSTQTSSNLNLPDLRPAVQQMIVDPIALKSVYVSLALGTFGNSAQADMEEIETQSDKDCLTVTKRLLVNDKGAPAAELAAILSADNELRIWLKKRTFTSMFRRGVYRAPYTLLDSICERFDLHEKERQGPGGLVDQLIDAYPRLQANAERQLRKQWRASDYMDADRLRKTFTMKTLLFQLDTPLALATIRKDMYASERAKAAQVVMDEVEIIRQTLRLELKELTSHMVERLSGTDDKGKPKIFRESMLGNIREFLSLFESRNLADDGELSILVKNARDAVAGVSTEDLRESANVRKTTRDAFAQIQLSLDGMMQAKPARSIRFD